MAQLQKNQSYPEFGFKVDGKGVAIDLTTGQGLPKATVDQRLAGTDTTQLAKQRGGVAGVFDRNKAVIKPVAELGAGALGFLAGGPAGAAAAGGAAGAAFGGFDRPGQSGVGFDVGKGVTGGLGGVGLGMVGGAGASALGAGGSSMPTTSDFGNVANAGVHNTYMPPFPVEGLTGAAAGMGAGSTPGGAGANGSGAPSAGGGGWQDILKGLAGKAGSFVTGNNGLNALGIAQGVNAANLSKQSTDYAKSALASATGAYDAKAPLRAAGISNMTNVLGTPAPTTSGLSQIAARNPFAARSAP
jgi:hypothetical protein